jgi:pimeloyl-ACP methyl ester carboxylesterase
MELGAVGSIVKILLGAAIALPAAAYLLQDRLIFQPQRMPEGQRAEVLRSHPGVRSRFLEASDGTRLHAWEVASAPGAPLVIYFGGNAEDVSWMIGEARRRAPDAAWLLVDYRGYGSSGGSPSEQALVSDALQWFDAAKAGSGVFVFGRSLGSGVAVQLAAQRRVDGVILVAPFDSLVEVAGHHYPFLPVSWLLRHRFDSAARAGAIDAPLLCLAAERDEVIPVVHAKRLFGAWAGPKRWVELAGAGHNSTDGAPQFWDAIRSFLEKNNEKPA